MPQMIPTLPRPVDDGPRNQHRQRGIQRATHGHPPLSPALMTTASEGIL